MTQWSENKKEPFIADTVLLLLTSLFLSRALLSFFTAGFFVICVLFYQKQIRESFSTKNLHFLAFGGIFLLAFVSGLFSYDLQEWKSRSLVKLPLLLLPIAMVAIKLSEDAIYWIHQLFILLVTGGTVYTMSMFYLNTETLLQGYQQAAVLPTLLENDHIRFSWCVVIAIILVAYQHSRIHQKHLQIINILLGCWLFIFLHILMSKTGLLMMYMAMVIFMLNYSFTTRKKYSLFFLLLLFLAPLISYQTLPTFKKRVDYMLYDYSFYSKGNYREGLSDAARLVSLKAGLSIVQQAPFTGIGYGDVEMETRNYYHKYYQMQEYEKILPSSQFLLIAAATGVTGLLVFVAVLLLPFFNPRLRKNIYFLCFYIPAIFSFSFEISLESQFGVFIFSFFTLWLMKFVQPPKPV